MGVCAVIISGTVFPVGRRGIKLFLTNFVEPGFQYFWEEIYSCVKIFRTCILFIFLWGAESQLCSDISYEMF